MILYPCCKINVGLDVIARRADGYHDLETVMIPVKRLCDILEIVPKQGDGLEFAVSGLALDCMLENNLCLKAYHLMAKRFNVGGVRMRLHKLIPSGAGLGGGSSDASAVIIGLNRVFKLGLSTKVMESLAIELGSDTAFFINGRSCLARGRGEILSPLSIHKTIQNKMLVIVKPPFGVSTSEAYAGITPRKPLIPLIERFSQDISMWRDNIVNDFERHIFKAHPVIETIKNRLYELGAIYASMSGSGSAVYGIFQTESDPFRRELFTPDDETLPDMLKVSFPDAFIYQQVMD